MFTVIDWVVAPFDQRLPELLGEVKVTLFPAQNVVGPLVVTVIGVPVERVIEVGKLVALHNPVIETE